MNTDRIQQIDLASFGEDQACRFLMKKGCKILNRNYRIRQGEIDIIARDGNLILFVEVKARVNSNFAAPWEAVGYRKRNRLRLAAKMYIREKSLYNLEFRFDVISITLSDSMKPEIEWIQDAF